jgi:hypothetical protein
MSRVGRPREMRMRLLEEKDFEAFRTLFDEAFSEYLEFLRHEHHEQFLEEVAERERVTREGFDFYPKMGLLLWLKKKEK